MLVGVQLAAGPTADPQNEPIIDDSAAAATVIIR